MKGAVIGQKEAERGSDAWKRAAVGTRIHLELIPEFWESGIRRDGTKALVTRLRDTESLWVSWFERWYVEPEKRFLLDAVSLGFWKRMQEFQQLFRAEWDRWGVQSPERAQPHWNIDHGILAAPPPAESRLMALGGLQEVSPRADHPIDISRYHLCMSASWLPQGQRGWRRPFGDPDHLVNWLDLCLEHIGAEFRARTAS